MNKLKQKDELSKPSSAGRVSGYGVNMKWREHYKDASQTRKERKSSGSAKAREVEELREKVSQIPQLVQDEVGKVLTSLLPTMMASLDSWNQGGREGPMPIPSVTGSNSHSVPVSVSPEAAVLVTPPAGPRMVMAPDVLVTPPADTAAPNLNAPGRENTPAGTTSANAVSITRPPAVCGASTLAELDALTGAAPVPCTLLHYVNSELKDVAKGHIIRPDNKMYHNNPLPPHMYKVKVEVVLPGFDNMDPPVQPHGADEHLPLGQCFNWSLIWPKSQIRLGTGGTTPRETPPIVTAPSHGKEVAMPQPSAPRHVADPGMNMAQDPDDIDVAGFIDDHGYTDDQFMPPFEETYVAKECRDQVGPAEKPNCNKRLFSSQETPPAAASSETQTDKGRLIISPNTLHRVTNEVNAIPLKETKKKARKRKSGKATASQPAPNPIRAQDGPPRPKDIMWRVHIAGEPMLSNQMLSVAGSHMRSLHDAILTIEKRRLREKDQAYPVFVAKVPKGMGFVDKDSFDVLFLRFAVIYNMFHLKPLHHTLVRLFSLSMHMKIIRDKTPGIAIVDPFYMRASHLCTEGDRQIATTYLQRVMVENKTKNYILMPYFSSDEQCTLISFCPRWSQATYFDSDRESKKDYDNIKKVLDGALTGYALSGGTFKKEKKKYGMHLFTHTTEFPCVKQPPGSQKDSYYALHHMRSFVRDQQDLTLPSHLHRWADSLGKIQDSDLRQEFFRIQQQFAGIIFDDVLPKTGEFFGGSIAKSNRDIDIMLHVQGDDRSFMTMTRDGFIHAPEPSQKS